MDIDGWLRGIGLEQYAQTFRDNAIDADVLCDLTDEHLRELGLPLGARLKLLRAVAALSTGQTPVSPEITTPAPRTEAERRQVTVMFSDLVGSTALSARMDPEDLREVISTYQKCVADTVGRFGGFVAKYMGDGVLVYFGYPHAHEDDAERAVRAGLELVAAVTSLKTQASLQTRVGIATGLVVVGDLIGSGASQEQAIVGETPNLAARLQGIAEPNSVVIAESTRKLMGNLFELEDLGTKDLKGIAGPVRAWAALRTSSAEGRFEALHTAGLTALVGREEESELLMRRWSRAKTGEGQVVLLSGEAGIGKSRLTAALLERLSGEPHTRLRYFCSPQHTDSAFYPIISQMNRAAGITHDDTLPTKLDKLDAVLAQTSTSKQDAALFAEMLSLPNDGRYPALDPDPLQRRQKTLKALNVQMEVLSRSHPVLMIVEDVHWSDPTSLEAFGRAVASVANHRVLMIVTFRHEFKSPWIGRPHVTFLSLNRLPQRDIDVMIDGVVGNRSLPASIRRDIIERTDGIPLFVEEMTKAVLEAESESAAATIAAPVRSAAFAVPASLHASLMARLDRLGPAKEVAQTGAAIGREFSHSLLTAVASKPEVELNAALDRLIAAGLLFRQGEPPHASYLFKHALVQDTAYESLLKSRRQILHTRIAETLREKFANTAAEPELVAHHFTQAGLTESAIEWWGKAGDQALRRSAFKEAIAHLGKAIEMTEKLGAATPAAPQIGERLRLQIAYGNALISARGYQAQETTAAFARARELAADSEDAAERYSAYYGAWASSYVRGKLTPMRELAEEFLRDAEFRPGLPEASVAHRVFGGTCWFQGDFVTARRHLEEALSGYDPKRDRGLAFRFGQDVVVSAMINLAHVLWPLGELVRARRRVDEALALAMQSGHVPTMAYGQYYKCLFEAVARDAARAIPHADALVGLSREHGLPFFLTSGTFYHGWTRWHAGDREAGTAEMRRGIALAREHGIGLTLPLYCLLMAEAEAEAGRVEAGLTELDELLSEIERTGQRWIEAQLNRVRGELLIRHKPADTAAAEGAFMQSLAVARRQQTKTFELQAGTSLARLWRDQGKRTEARDLLASVYGWFTEGFDTLDLKEAKALLDELAT